MHMHTYAHKHTCACMTPSTRSNTDTETHNLCTDMHTHTHTHVYKRIHIHYHTHMHICIYIHVCTHTHIHIYTHTHTKCTYERTSETTSRQRLRGKPNLTPRSSALLLVRCNPEGDTLRGQQPNCPSRGTTDKRRTTTTNSSSSHHHDSAPSRPHLLICTGVESIHPIHGPPKLRACPWPPETRSFSCYFGGFFVCSLHAGIQISPHEVVGSRASCRHSIAESTVDLPIRLFRQIVSAGTALFSCPFA